MKLKLIDYSSSPYYGEGGGTIDTTEYECPCGKGKVIYKKDNIAGYRDSWMYIECEDCRKKYKIKDGELELIERK